MAIDELIEGFLMIFPAMVANATPVVAKGKIPIDFGANFIDGRRLLGRSKTWEGLIAGMAAGTLTGILLALLLNRPEMAKIGLIASGGAMAGDLAASFIKRRLNMQSGDPAPILDQLNFYVGAVTALWLFGYTMSAPVLIALAVISGILHLGANVVAHLLGLKEHPW